MRRVRVHGFPAPREATGRRHRGLDLSRNRGQDIIVGCVNRYLGVLWDGEARSGPSVGVLSDMRLLLRLIHAWVDWRQCGGYSGLLRHIGGRNRGDVVHVQAHVSRGLLLLLKVLVAVLLEGRSDLGNDGLNLSLERFG